ncbi:MAG: FadR family transcriptional regulator [Robiginitomaculum sp.]|nr:FadR family transcriptional regulator [Robiginitomaculum sp.]
MAKKKENRRTYQKIADLLLEMIEKDGYEIGARLPAERDLAERFGVSRPTIREAVIALEIAKRIEVKKGSGVYVLGPNKDGSMTPELDIGPFELTEARALVEGEAAALAATLISDEEIEQLKTAIEEMSSEGELTVIGEEADRRFHQIIARATRNDAISAIVNNLWEIRQSSKITSRTYQKARGYGLKDRQDEHRTILMALEARDPQAARRAMRAHLMNVIDALLIATETDAVTQARERSSLDRTRFTSMNKII